MNNHLPSFSIIIEWDNARLSELQRASEMLRTLARQVAALEVPKPPVLIVYDTEVVEESTIRHCFGMTDTIHEKLDIAILPNNGLAYYQQKNFGFDHTKTDVVIFLDSDVIPQPGWLSQLLSAMCDPALRVVCGNTFVSYGTLYEKAFALFWFYPLKSDGSGLRRSRHFFANNVAFRREVFDAYRFPELQTFRGQCLAVAQKLSDDGIPIYRQGGASVEHPPPGIGAHFLWHALSYGHDEVVMNRVLRRPALKRGLPGAFYRLVSHLASAGYRIARYHRKVGLSPLAAPVALCMAVAYYVLKWVGEILSLVNPRLIRDNAII